MLHYLKDIETFKMHSHGHVGGSGENVDSDTEKVSSLKLNDGRRM